MMTKTTFARKLEKYGNYETAFSTYTDTRGRKYFTGYILNPENKVCVYVNTESCYNAHCENKMLVRYAKCIGDTTGGTNRFITPNNSAYLVWQMLRNEKWYNMEFERGTK